MRSYLSQRLFSGLAIAGSWWMPIMSKEGDTCRCQGSICGLGGEIIVDRNRREWLWDEMMSKVAVLIATHHIQEPQVKQSNFVPVLATSTLVRCESVTRRRQMKKKEDSMNWTKEFIVFYERKRVDKNYPLSLRTVVCFSLSTWSHITLKLPKTNQRVALERVWLCVRSLSW